MPLMRSIKSIEILGLLSLTLTWLLYGRGVSLPFYSDDLLQIPFMQSTPWFAFWYTAGPYGDYRPLHFTLWRIFYWVVGPNQPMLFHSLNIFLHAVCGLWVGALALRRQEASPWFAAACTAIFIAFPFAFDGVLWVSSFSYPLVTALTVCAVVVYLLARTNDNPRLYVLAMALTLLAGFAFEGGIITGAIILLTEITLAPRPFSRWAIVGVATSILPFMLIAGFTPAASGTFSLLPPIQNILAALQAIVFPVAPLATLAQTIGLNSLLALSIIGLLILFGIGYWLYRVNLINWFLFGLGWVALWCAIPLLTQNYNWMRDPMRVFYPSAAGIAIIWALVIDAPRKWWPLQAALAALIILPASLFVYSRTTLYEQAGKALQDAIAVAYQTPDTVFINLPGRITPNQRWYPLGHEGPILMPPPNTITDVVRVNTGLPNTATERSAGNILPALDYTIEPAGESLGLADIRSTNPIVSTTYDSDQIHLDLIGQVTNETPTQPPAARFSDSIALVFAGCSQLSPTHAQIDLTWQLTAPLTGAPTTFVHLLNAAGEIVAQADGDPLHGLYPFAQWQVGELVTDVRTVRELSNSIVGINVGVWEPATSQRWEAVDANGNALPDGVLFVSCP
jgi:hypothetical protein